jgi:hypothetical protein
MTQLNREPDFLFTLRVCVFADEPLVVVNAFEGRDAGRDAGRGRVGGSHNSIDVEVRQGGRVVFPRGQLYCGLPTFRPIDGPDARELVLSLVAMKPGDTDRDYFEHYTPEQLAWAERHGDGVSYAASRYAPKEKA